MRNHSFISYIVLMLTILVCSCSKTSDDDDNKVSIKEPEAAVFYVKYSYICGNPQHYSSFTINYTNDKLRTSSKIYEIDGRSHSGEIICGPFKLGDVVELSTSNEVEIYSRLLEISVSKNNSPFALKVSENSNYIKYVIE